MDACMHVNSRMNYLRHLIPATCFTKAQVSERVVFVLRHL